MNSKTGKITLLLALIGLIALQAKYLLRTPIAYGFSGSIDFIQYWSSNLLLGQNQNPYDPKQMLDVQRSLGLVGENPIMMWVAPWVLVILKPFLVFNFETSFLSFLVFNVFSLIFCSYILQITYSTNKKFSYTTCLLALFFLPAWDCINYGQISIILLLALCLANYFLEKNKILLASLCFSILSIKPHLFIYLAALTFFWALQNNRLKLIYATTLSTTALLSLYYFQNRTAIFDWIAVMTNYGSEGSIKTSQWAAATIGTWLRVIFGVDKIYLIWLPCLLALLFLAYLLFNKGLAKKSYKEILPLSLSISLLSSPYAWLYDQSLFLICQVFIFYNNKAAPRKLFTIQAIYLLIIAHPNWAQQHFAALLGVWVLYSACTDSVSKESSSAASSGEKS